MQQVVLFNSNQDKTDHLQEGLIVIESDLEKILLKKENKLLKVTESILKNKCVSKFFLIFSLKLSF